MHIVKPLVGGGSFYPYPIGQSCRFNDDDSAQLSQSTVLGNTVKFTISFWVKRCTISTAQTIASAGTSINDNNMFRFNSDDTFNFYRLDSAAATNHVAARMAFRDTTNWYHIVVAVDGNQAIASDRVKIYVNGAHQTDLGYTNYPALGSGQFWNWSSGSTLIGARVGTPSEFFDGYIAEFYNVSGRQLDPTAFGVFKKGVWVPIKYTGSYGTGGFYLNFADSTALGNDASGNNNDFTSFGLDASDQVLDTPTNNYCTVNPLFSPGAATYTDGNLVLTTTIEGVHNYQSTFAIPNSGKWYWESKQVSAEAIGMVGIGGTHIRGDRWGYTDTPNISYSGYSGSVKINDTSDFYGSAWGINDIIGIAVDMDAGEITFYKNNVSQGTIAIQPLNPGELWAAMFTDGASIYSTTYEIDFGQLGFTYTPPAGYKALCSKNLPEPDIIDGSEGMDILMWTGDGTSPKSRSGLTFCPDMVWSKNRDAAADHGLIDTVRGVGNTCLNTNSTGAEGNAGGTVVSFDSGGFTTSIGSMNHSWFNNNDAQKYVAWCFRKGPKYGLDIVTYTGNSVAGRTVEHRLGAEPELMIVKSRSSDHSWAVYHYHASTKTDPETDLGVLNYHAAWADDGTIWSDVRPTSTVYTCGTGVATNENGTTYIAYLFRSIEGFSRVFSYVANGNTDGPFVHCGFRPRFILLKNASIATSWSILDAARNAYNPISQYLVPNYPNVEAVESDGECLDFTSNGFKVRTASGTWNHPNSTIIGIAFAANPFKYTNAF